MSSSQQSPKTPTAPARSRAHTPRPFAECSSNPSDFLLVSIHTAKCSSCDARNNSDQMRRCQGCGWQICLPCQNERIAAGKTLTHGNSTSPSRPRATPNRRVLFNSDNVTPLRPSPLKSVPLEERKVKSNRSVAGGPKKDEVAEVAEASQSTAQEVTSPTSSEKPNARKRAREAKGKYREPSLSSEEAISEPESPALNVKRSKTNLRARSPTSIVRGSSASRRRQSGSQRAGASELLMPSLPEPYKLESKGIRPSQQPEVVQNYYGLPDTNYQQHPLARSHPVVTNPTVRIPPSIARNFKPRKTEEEIWRGIQEKVRARMAHAEAGPTSSIAAGQPSKTTLREFVDAEFGNLQHGIELDEDQQDGLAAAMREVARKFRNQVVEQMAPDFRACADKGLKLLMTQLTEVQKQDLQKAVQDEAARKLKEFEDEATRLKPPSHPGVEDVRPPTQSSNERVL